MLPLPIPYKTFLIALCVILAGVAGYIRGHTVASDRYAPEIAQLKAAIVVGDAQAKSQQSKNMEALDENRKVAKDLAGRILAHADERAGRVRELQARNTALTAITAGSTAGDIPTSCESNPAGQLAAQEIKYIELEGRCITDAAARVVIKDWAMRIGLKQAQ